GVEQSWTSAPHDGAGDLAALVGRDDFVKLAYPLQPEDNHERLVQLGLSLGGAITRRFFQREIESEQRRQQVVLKTAGCGTDLGRNGVGVEKLHERLLRVQTRGNEPRVQSFAIGKLNADGLSLTREDGAK